MTAPIDEERRHHLDLIQASVARMASNAFQVKGWNIALGGAILALNQKDDVVVLAGGLAMSIILWMLDAYYLRLERAFRGLYDAARKGEASAAGHILSPETWYAEQCYIAAFFARAVFPLHFAIMLGLIVLIVQASDNL